MFYCMYYYCNNTCNNIEITYAIINAITDEIIT